MASNLLLLMLLVCLTNFSGLYVSAVKFTCDMDSKAKLANKLNSPSILALRDVALSHIFVVPQNLLVGKRTISCKSALKILEKLAQENSNTVLDFILHYYQSDILSIAPAQREYFLRKITTRKLDNVLNFYSKTNKEDSLTKSRQLIKGKTLIFSSREQKPSIYMKLNKENTTVISYSGDMVEIFSSIAKNLQFNFTAVPALEASTFVNGSWRGVVGMLARKEIDLTLQPLNLDFSRNAVADFTTGLPGSTFTLLIPYPKEERSLLASSWPFTPMVWLSLFITITIVVITLTIVSVLKSDVPLLKALTQSFMYVYGIIVCQGMDYPGRTHKSRFIAGIWGLAALLFVYLYNSQLTSFLTVLQLYPLVNSLDDLANSNKLKVIAMPGNTFLPEALAAKSGPYKLIGDRIRNNLNKHIAKDHEDAVNKVVSGEYAFAVSSYYAVYYGNMLLRKSRKCTVMLIKQPFQYFHTTVMMQKHSPYLPIINYKFMQISEGGIVAYIMKYSEYSFPSFTDFCKVPVKDISTKLVLTLGQLESAFALLGIGLIASLIVFVYEFFASKRCCRINN